MVSLADMSWIHPPARFTLSDHRLEVYTDPRTDLWQRTFYGFQRDNAHLLCATTAEAYFSFTVTVEYDYRHLYDQAGLVVWLDPDHWMKASVEAAQPLPLLGCVVTNHGYSDWSTQPVPADQRIMWYRLSRRVSDFRVDWSTDGQAFHQLRLFHLAGADAQIQYGLLACSPTDGPFRAVFSQPRLTECLWEAE